MELGGESRLSGERGEGLGKVRDIFRVDGEGGVGDDFGEGTASAADNRGAAGHGFDRRKAEALEEAGIDHAVGTAVEIRQVLVGDKAEEFDGVSGG